MTVYDMSLEIDRMLWIVSVYEELNCIEMTKSAQYVAVWEINAPPTPVKPFPDNEAAADISAHRSIGFRSHENVALLSLSVVNALESLRRREWGKEKERGRDRLKKEKKKIE